MFKNRIRTAAIAGIAALATGLSGIAVPSIASAQTPTQGETAPGAPAGEYWNDRDASAAFDAEPVNHTEDELKLATDVTQEFIEAEAAQTWTNLHSGLDYDPSEEATAGRLRVIHEDILEAQQVNSDAIKRVRESIAYAYQQDLEATEAWQAVVERAYEINLELREEDKAPRAASQQGVPNGVIHYVPNGGTEADAKPLEDFEDDEFYTIIELVNFFAVRDGFDPISATAQDALETELTDNPSDQAVRDFYLALQDIANRQDLEDLYEELGQFYYDGNLTEEATGPRFSRHAAEAIIELYGEVQGYLAELDELLDESAKESREAQQSDVLVRQGFLQRALAQREVLRNAEGLVLALSRYVELYNDDALTADRNLLSTEYRRVLDNLYFSLFGGTFQDIDDNPVTTDGNLELLDGINDAVLDAWDTWTTDLFTNADATDIREGIFDEWNFAIVEERLDTSAALYYQLVQQGKQWREALNRVIAVEKEINAPSDNDRLIEAIKDLANNDDDNDDDTPGNPGSGEDIDGGSSLDIDGSSDGGFGTIGILAGIAAVIGLIAAAVPFLGNFIPNLPF